MARIFMEGFEHPGALHPWMTHTDGVGSIVGGVARSGSYALQLYVGGATTPRTAYINLPAGVQREEFYFRVAFRSPVVTSQNRPLLHVYSNTGQELARVNIYTTQIQVVVLGTSRIVSAPPASLTNNTYYLLELHVKMGATEGLVELRFGGIPLGSWAGPVQGTGTTIARVWLNTLASTATTSAVDDIAINDADGPVNNSWCGDGHILALRPTGVGDASQWADQAGNQAANWAAVDEVTPDNDTTCVVAHSSDLVDTYHLANATLAEGDVIKAVQVLARARTLVEQGDELLLGTRLDSNEAWSSPAPLLLSYSSFVSGVQEKAAGNTSWNLDKLNNLQAGIKSGNDS
ncbi:hypothetical protein [Aggregatilinea lenta]|uniref:hypothetical protein n=1 Tax=Aggregatilinea lenta TaxID=913108 RepID=UPI000E5C5161|nr:hypothetical protein [Aggregatilinea lenta]